MRLDHVSYATSPAHLADVVQRIGSKLHRSFVDGGIHPRFGTRNFILPLAAGAYVEVVATLDHPSADSAPFRLAVHERAERGGGWMGWAVAVDDLAPVEARLGRSGVPGHRVRPDGHDLRWRQIGVNDLRAEPSLPFFTCWEGDGSDHPSTGGANGARLSVLTLGGDPERVVGWLGASPETLLERLTFDWLPDEEPALAAVTFETASGPVTID
jgi:hypothetical protein